MENKTKLTSAFFDRDVLEAAPDLVGKLLCRKMPDGERHTLRITETEAYRGTEDGACHASKGRTPRAEVLFMEAGHIYVYLVYGMHILLNIVTEQEEIPQAILVRACESPYDGPGKLTKHLCIDMSFNKQKIDACEELWIEDDGYRPTIDTKKRVGIDYAPPLWRDKPWRFTDKKQGGKETKA